MKINRRLNMVMPIDLDDGRTIYVHAMPVGVEVFEQFFMPISETFATIYGRGLGAIAGPRTAAMILKDFAKRAGIWEGDLGVEIGFFNEMKRLTNVIVGGETIMLEEAVKRGLIDDEDRSEVENALVFFTVISLMQKRSEVPVILAIMSKLWDVRITSLNCTEYATFLKTSTPVANTGVKATP